MISTFPQDRAGACYIARHGPGDLARAAIVISNYPARGGKGIMSTPQRRLAASTPRRPRCHER